ncbi:hypothetical protein GCM10010425_60300 [Streptomyces spororaveus]|uniref:Uncharacterized protein n=1 Tax=Streptomyces spororaveus TaxID=284039 RepID=A0ABQ3TG72_9ACTN|nr:hypothetical protein [Streptomyces spororaveus]GHI79418.1 hypothetical protein Sspor_49790 [Streptomyces spororaveus]
MTHRSRTHRLALLCVSTALATGALLTSPAGPAAAAVDAYAAPQYLATVTAGASGFSVYDMPGDRYPLDEQLQGFVDAFSLVGLGTVTSHDVRKSTVDGRPVLDARLSGKNGDESTVGFIRLISDDDHLVLAMTLGLEADKKELNGMHQQLIDSLKIP